MAFDKNLMARGTASLTDGKVATLWFYGPSLDAASTIAASGYFDDWNDQINKDDLLYLVGSDENNFRAFDTAQGVTPVTLTTVIDAGDLGPNSVGTGAIVDTAVTTVKLADGAVTTVKIATDAVTSGKILDGQVLPGKLTANSFNGRIAENVFDGNTAGGFVLLFRESMPGGASNTKDILMDFEMAILDVWVITKANGSASDTITIQNVTTNMTNAIDVSVVANKRVGITDLITAQSVVAASTNLRIVQTDGSGDDSPAVNVFILAARL